MPVAFAAGAPRCVLIVAPHADDEAIGGFALAQRLRRRGVAVRIVVVTDGAASHPASPRWPRRRLVAERRRETRREMRRIGVPAAAIAFLDLPDGGLTTIPERVRRRLGAVVRRAPRPLLLVGPCARDHHADHRAVAAALTTVGGAGIRRLAYPVWPAGRGLPGARALTLSGQERLAKRHALRRYRTQAGGISDDPGGFAMTRAQLAAFTRPTECFLAVRR